MAKAWWLLVVLSCACSDPDSDGESGAPAASLTVTLSDQGGRTCAAAAETTYRLGTEDAPLTDGENGAEVSCEVHSTETDSWFGGRVAGKEAGGENIIFSISNENGLELAFASTLTGALELDPIMASNCVPTFAATVGNAVTSDFDCGLLVDPTNTTNGCGVSGIVSFENCSM